MNSRNKVNGNSAVTAYLTDIFLAADTGLSEGLQATLVCLVQGGNSIAYLRRPMYCQKVRRKVRQKVRPKCHYCRCLRNMKLHRYPIRLAFSEPFGVLLGGTLGGA